MIKSHGATRENRTETPLGDQSAKSLACLLPVSPPRPPETGGAPTSLDLADGLRALADAGLSPDALAAAVEALLRAARPATAPVPLRRVDGA